jgi:hypothetical protein
LLTYCANNVLISTQSWPNGGEGHIPEAENVQSHQFHERLPEVARPQFCSALLAPWALGKALAQ